MTQTTVATQGPPLSAARQPQARLGRLRPGPRPAVHLHRLTARSSPRAACQSSASMPKSANWSGTSRTPAGWAKTPQAVNDHDFRSQRFQQVDFDQAKRDATCPVHPATLQVCPPELVPAYRHGLSLPQRRLQVEPHRPSPVQRDQQELGWPSAAQLPDHPQPHPYHLHCHRATGARRVGRRRVSPRNRRALDYISICSPPRNRRALDYISGSADPVPSWCGRRGYRSLAGAR